MSQSLATAGESRDATMAAAPLLTRTLRFTRPMMRGDDVVWLQTRLQANGWGAAVAGSVRAIDGLFGPGTEGAVRNFQKAYGLQVDGIVGPITWSRLMLCPSLDAGSLDAAQLAAEALKRVQASFLPQRHLQPEALAGLAQWHSRFSGGGQWRLTAQGLEVRNDSIPASAGLDARTALVLREWFGAEIRAQARKSGVPVELIVATICTESAGSARDRASCTAAERKERGFRSEAATPHRISIGCMQTLISTACGTLGRTVSGAELRDPAVSIEAGTAYIAQQAGRTLLDPPVVACAYNAGSVRHEPSASNRWRMVQYPVGTSAHADRFASFFNACLRLLQREPGLAADAPSFAAALSAGGAVVSPPVAPPPAGPGPAPAPVPGPGAAPFGGPASGMVSLVALLGGLVLREGDNDATFRWGGIEQPGRAERPIEALQRALDAAGMLDSKVDGEFGPATRRALRRFQWYARHHRSRLRGGQREDYPEPSGIQLNGECDASSATALEGWSGCAASSPLVLVRASALARIRRANGFTTLPQGAGDDQILVHADFLPALRILDEAAQQHGVELRLNQAFRVAGAPVSGAVVPPATRSQHLIGRAVDVNIVLNGQLFTSDMLKGELPPEIQAFIQSVKSQGLRWGGDFAQKDTVHFDLRVPDDSEDYEMEYFFCQNGFGRPGSIRLA